MPTSLPTPPHGRPLGAPGVFQCDGYEILDSQLVERGEVMLWSTGGPAPCRGELFTIERDRQVYDLSVIDVTGHNPGWSALCRRVTFYG